MESDMRDVAIDRQLGLGDTARLLALGNLAARMPASPSGTARIHYNYWRPITAIREGDSDNNPNTKATRAWTPFIQTLSAQTRRTRTTCRGANGVTGAFTTILQLYFKSDFVRSPSTRPRSRPPAADCTTPGSSGRISDAADEVVEARILLGIHFRVPTSWRVSWGRASRGIRSRTRCGRCATTTTASATATD
jgi:hypothetical protein